MADFAGFDGLYLAKIPFETCQMRRMAAERSCVGAQQVLNLTMQVGTVTERVEIAGEAPTVQLASSAPISAMALFIASVILSGAWRAKYSLNASLLLCSIQKLAAWLADRTSPLIWSCFSFGPASMVQKHLSRTRWKHFSWTKGALDGIFEIAESSLCACQCIKPRSG
jgi:hypothetical protein